MASKKTLASCLSPPAVFSRAAQLERDLDDPSALEAYYPTPRAVAFLSRVIQAHAGETSTGAWTLTGPYGAGKSSCALFLSALLDRDTPSWEPAWERLFEVAEDLEDPDLSGYCPCVVTARREPVAVAILRAIAAGAIRTWGPRKGRNPGFLKEVNRLLASAETGESVPIEGVLGCLSELLKGLKRLKKDGCLLLVDELGLALEFAAHNPESSDLELLQLLAEKAHKPRKGEARLFFVTILHQAFEDYARRLPQNERREWAKVQGRFEDGILVDADLDSMRLVNHALATSWPTNTKSQLKKWSKDWLKLGLVPALGDLKASEQTSLVVGAYPLDPVALGALPALSRRFAQNGRTLFSFLASSEGFSLPAVAAKLPAPSAESGLPTVSLPELYDFFVEAQNVASLRPGDQALWCEVKDGVERSLGVASRHKTDSEELLRLAKTIAILQLASVAGASVRADRQTLQHVLWGSSGGSGKKLTRLLGVLTERGIVTYRRHSESYRIWRGSDFDIEEGLRAVRSAEGTELAAVDLINSERLFAPVVAQRHSVTTGTLRYFQCLVSTRSTLDTVLERLDEHADGYVLLLLERSSTREEIEEERELLRGAEVLLGFPGSWQRVLELASELVGMRELRKQRSVRADSTAQREVRERAAEIEKHLRDLLEGVFNPANTDWSRAGQPVPLASRRDLNREVSKACDEAFPQTPIVHNELINRRQLSSTSSAARGALLRAMLESEALERLGIEGFPPESSMYASVLEKTGIHALDPEFELFPGSAYRFGSPREKEQPRLFALWNALNDFLDSTGKGEQTADGAFELMGSAPFGVKRGLQPVLFLACFLSRQEEVAIYEEGTFLPALTTESLERLVKKPQLFSLRRFGVAGVRSAIFRQFKSLVGEADAPANIKSLLLVVRPLLSFAHRTPDFTKKTRRISGEAQEVRKALLGAKDPDLLLFETLPKACGFDPLEGDALKDSDAVELFFVRLRAVLKELRDTYDNLLVDLRQILLVAFGEEDKGAKEGREAIAQRAGRLRRYVTEARLTALLMRVSDATLGESEWTETLAALILNRPASAWDDAAVGTFEVRVNELARRFRQIERLAFELNTRSDLTPANAVRLTFTRATGMELDAVLCRSASLSQVNESLVGRMKSDLANLENPTQLAILAELTEWLLERQRQQSEEPSHVES